MPAATMDARIIQDLKKLLSADLVLHTPEDLMLYEYDGSTEVARPDCVVFPMTRDEVVGIVRLAMRYQIPIVGRGAGTGLSGGALARKGGVIVSFARMKKILKVDAENLRAVVQPGLVNADLSAAVAPLGLFYAPDPSSQRPRWCASAAGQSTGPATICQGYS